MRPDEKRKDPSLALDILGPSSELATSTLTLSVDPTVSSVSASAATIGAASASNQVNQATGVTVSLQRHSLHVYISSIVIQSGCSGTPSLCFGFRFGDERSCASGR